MDAVRKLKVIEFLDGLYFATIITSLFAIAEGMTLSQVVFAQGLYSLSVIAMEVPTGIVADKFGRKISVGLGYLMSCVGIGLFVLNPSVILLYVMRFIQATGSTLISGASEALLFEASKEQGLNYKKQSSIALSNRVLGLCAAGIIAGVAFERFDQASFVPLMVATMVVQVAAALLAFSVKEKRDPAESQAASEAKVWSMLSDTVSLMRNNKTIFGLTMFGLLAACNEYFLYQTYGPYFETNGVSNFWVGAAFSLGLLLNFGLQRNIYRIENHLSLEKALVLIKLTAAAGYLGLALATRSTVLVIVLISTIGIFNVERPLISDYANQEISNRIRVTVLSGMTLMSRITKALLTFVIGGIIVHNPVTTGYYISGLYMVAGTVVGYWLLVRCGCIRKVTHRAEA